MKVVLPSTSISTTEYLKNGKIALRFCADFYGHFNDEL